ncbi:response regulator transcription factor [Bacteroidales bacterium OttesenSCG-928-L14]|nr:response regulator transcription factor [Bacteroidales bacterium OttesenSCG-928-L14]
MINVYITDDHVMLVEGIEKAINESKIAHVNNTFFDIESCRKALIYERPDVLLLDISLPDGSGIDYCKEVHELYPNVKIIAITSHDEYSIARKMLENGAMGYILKNSSAEELIEGIEAVYNGEKYLCDRIENIIKRRSSNEVYLSEREKEILRLIVDGYTNPEIADKLNLSPLTIKGYRKNLILKLDVKNTASLVNLVLTEKLI